MLILDRGRLPKTPLELLGSSSTMRRDFVRGLFLRRDCDKKMVAGGIMLLLLN